MITNSTYTCLRLILGDQLNARHSWYTQKDEKCLYLIAELRQETDYVKHHVQKLCGFFLAMEAFACALKQSGHQILHMTLDDTSDFVDLPSLIRFVCQKYDIQTFEYQRPDEYRLLRQLQAFEPGSGIAKNEWDTEHFLVPFDELGHRFKPSKPGRMEHFYRGMRREYDLLMDDNQPVGGKWNYDAENRCKLKSADVESLPEPLVFANPVAPVLKRLRRHNVACFGEVGEHLVWPVTRQQALMQLNHFCRHCLPRFGQFQDAMTGKSVHAWSLYHSRLSFALNTKMLHPKQVLDAAIEAWQHNQETVSLPQIEGFVRQIAGWREYIRGVYWSNMPGYESMNALNAQETLPEWFWTGQTRMNCLRQSITQSLKYAYAHHIQRLMITGNFCLLAGIDPDQVDQWYLGIYIDAIEWVELPNTRGMSQYADGGMVASKPYAGGGNYIHKMSDYCSDCIYSVKEKATEAACPLNSLYWYFMDQNQALVQKNPRTAMIYKSWLKREAGERHDVLKRAKWCIQHINEL